MVKKVNVVDKNMSAEILNQISNILISLDVEGMEIPNKSLRSIFQEQFKDSKMDFTASSKIDKSYKDLRVQALYVSFKTALVIYTKSIRRSLKLKDASSVKAPFIIGMQVIDGTVQFGYRPFKHKTPEEANRQAKALAARHNKSYTVFGALDTVSPVNTGCPKQTPVSETKQGPSGRLKSYTAEVTESIQALTKEVDIDKEVFPSGIKFLPDGQFAVTFYNDDKTIMQPSMSAAVRVVEKMMNEFKQSKTTTAPIEIIN